MLLRARSWEAREVRKGTHVLQRGRLRQRVHLGWARECPKRLRGLGEGTWVARVDRGPGDWWTGRPEGGCEGLDSCLILSTLLMNNKLDCQKLRGWLNEQFFVDDVLTTKVMFQNNLKIEHPEIESRYHGYQNVRTRCHL